MLVLSGAGSEVMLLQGGLALVDISGQAAGYGGQLMSLRFYNPSASARECKAYLVASGDGVGTDNLLIHETIPPNGTLLYEPKVPKKYKSYARVYAMQVTGNDVLAGAEAVEFY